MPSVVFDSNLLEGKIELRISYLPLIQSSSHVESEISLRFIEDKAGVTEKMLRYTQYLIESSQ